MTESIIDGLEPIEIKEKERDRWSRGYLVTLGLAMRYRLLHCRVQNATVG
jgi:hypothetical protein